jgi:hypothetical protein
MQTLSAHFDGKVIIPDEPPDLATGARLRVTVEPMDEAAAPAANKLDLPLLSGVNPEIVCGVMEDPTYDVENIGLEQFLRPTATEHPR